MKKEKDVNSMSMGVADGNLLMSNGKNYTGQHGFHYMGVIKEGTVIKSRANVVIHEGNDVFCRVDFIDGEYVIGTNKLLENDPRMSEALSMARRYIRREPGKKERV